MGPILYAPCAAGVKSLRSAHFPLRADPHGSPVESSFYGRRLLKGRVMDANAKPQQVTPDLKDVCNPESAPLISDKKTNLDGGCGTHLEKGES